MYFMYFYYFFMTDGKLFKARLFWSRRVVNRSLCLWPSHQKLSIQANKNFHLIFYFFGNFFPSDILHKISKLDIFSSLFHCKSCTDDFPQIDSLNLISYWFDSFFFKTFDTIQFRMENLFFQFSILSVRHTQFFSHTEKSANF